MLIDHEIHHCDAICMQYATSFHGAATSFSVTLRMMPRMTVWPHRGSSALEVLPEVFLGNGKKKRKKRKERRKDSVVTYVTG